MEGRFSFSLIADRSKKPVILRIEGILETDTYIDQLKTIENDRYGLYNIELNSESYGSEEDIIVYSFNAGRFKKFARVLFVERKENGGDSSEEKGDDAEDGDKDNE